MPYRNWERRPSWWSKRGEQVFPLYSQGAPANRPFDSNPGGVIYVFDADVDPEDCEYPPGLKHHIGRLTWVGNVVEWIEVNEGRQREAIATDMFELAQQINPRLHHSEGRLSDKARAWIEGLEAKKGWRDGPSLDQLA